MGAAGYTAMDTRGHWVRWMEQCGTDGKQCRDKVADLEECDGGTVAHAEQKKVMKMLMIVQSPSSSPSWASAQLSSSSSSAERGQSVFVPTRWGWGKSLYGRWVNREAQEKAPAGLGQ